MDVLQRVGEFQDCSRCGICPSPGRRPVYGRGTSDASYMIIGAAPGKNENATQEAYSGYNGQNLDSLIKHADIELSDVYVTNLVKGWPQKKLTAKAKEIKICADWLLTEIDIVQPELIITLGAAPLNYFFPDEKITACHGNVLLWETPEESLEPHSSIPVFPVFEPASVAYNPGNKEILINEFKTLLQRYEDFVQKGEKVLEYELIRGDTYEGRDATRSFNEYISTESGYISFDFETTDLRAWLASVVGVAVSSGERNVYISNPDLNLLSTLWSYPKLVAHNAKYETEILFAHNIRLQYKPDDSMVLATTLGVPLGGRGLKPLIYANYGERMTEFSDLVGKGTKEKSMAEIPPEIAAPYAVADSHWCLRYFIDNIDNLGPDLIDTYQMEIDLIPVIARMEMRGIPLSKDNIQTAIAELTPMHEEVVSDLRKIVKSKNFNPNSPPQTLSWIRGLGSTVKNTNAKTLQTIVRKYPDVQKVIEARHLNKLKGAYAESLLEMVPLAYGSANPSGTGTGRFSYSAYKIRGRQKRWGINLQTIPKPKMWEDSNSAESNLIRSCFSAPPGFVFVEADYSQIELRIAAHISKDENMIEAYKSGIDIHQKMQDDADLLSVLPNADYDAVRRVAKVLNFGLLYENEIKAAIQVVLRTCAEAQVVLTYQEAKDLVMAKREAFPGLIDYYNSIRFQLQHKGYVETEYGRRLYGEWFWGESETIQSTNARTLRQAINMPIQGTSADIIKRALIKLDEPDVQMLLTVHDDIKWILPKDEAEEYGHKAKGIMESIITLRVPVIADVKIGKNLAEMHEL